MKFKKNSQNSSYLCIVIFTRIYIFSVLFIIFSACNLDTNENARNKNTVLKTSSQPNDLPAVSSSKCSIDSNEILKTFLDFKKSILTSSAVDIIRISEMPIKGDCVYYILTKKTHPDQDIADGNITKEILFQNCQFLDSIELATLQNYIPFEESKLLDHTTGKYGAYIFVDDGAKQFQFSIGRIQSKNWDEDAEYSIIFTFKKIQNMYKLTTINCAG